MVDLMVIQDNGDVGIGTSSPSAKLDVNGNAAISSAGYAFLRLGAADANGFSISKETSNNSLNIWAGGVQGSPVANRLSINSSGNVGIGTASPTTKLDVVGTISTNASTALALKGGSGKYIHCESEHLAFYKKTGASHYYFRKSDDGTNAGANMVELMVIQDNGDVGIGTNSPSSKLDVVGNAKLTAASTSGTLIQLDNSGSAGGKTWNITSAGSANGSGAGALEFYTVGGGVINTCANPITNCPTTAKAWVNFNGTGPTIRGTPYNVSSVTKSANGNYTVNYTANMTDANYAVITSCGVSTAVTNGQPRTILVKSQGIGSANILHLNGSAVTLDSEIVTFAIFGN